MVNTKRIFNAVLCFCLLVILSYSAFAESFKIDVQTINSDIASSSDTAEFIITITNLQTGFDRFRLNYNQLQWDVETDPIRLTGVPLEGAASDATHFRIRPKDMTAIGLYQIPLTIYSEKTEEEQTVYLSVYVGKRYVPEYVPFITVEQIFNQNNYEVDPRKDLVIDFVIVNNNMRNYETVDFALNSELFSKTDKFPLAPKEIKRVSYKFKLSPIQAPISDVVTGTIVAGNVTFRLPKIDYTIKDYTGEFYVDYSLEKNGISTRIEKYAITNVGNARAKQNVEILENRLIRMFESYNVQPVSYKLVNGTGYSVFNFELDSQASTEVIRTYDFKILYVLLLFLALFVGYRIYMLSEVYITKTARITKTQQGGIFKIKVVLTLVNKAQRVLHDLELADRVPSLLELNKDFEVGSLEPYSVAKTKNGSTVIKWHINELEPREVRIVSYEIQANLSILGRIMLPYAILRYKKDEIAKIVTSNKADIGYD